MDAEKLYDKLYRYCYMKIRHPQTAEDLTQETFLRFLRTHRYEDCEKNAAYLYTIARNLCTDYYRSRKTEPLERAEEIPGEDGSEACVIRLALEQALERLPEEERELLFLRYTSEVSVGEAANILGISRFAVYRRERHALEQLRKQLNWRDFYA